MFKRLQRALCSRPGCIDTALKYRSAVSVLLMLFVLSGGVMLTPRYIAGSRLERARMLYQDGRIVEAAALASTIEKADPEYRKARRLRAEIKVASAKLAVRHYVLGREYEEAGIISTAITHYKRSLEFDSSNTAVARRLTLLEAARLQAGFFAWDKRAIFPETLETVDARYMKGRAYLEVGDFAEAITEFKAVLRILPSDTDTRRLLKAAERGLAEAVDTHLKKGMSYFEKEEMALAIKEWNIVLELDAGNVKAEEYKNRAEQIIDRLKKIKKRQTR